jgi:hypothetical protein
LFTTDSVLDNLTGLIAGGGGGGQGGQSVAGSVNHTAGGAGGGGAGCNIGGTGFRGDSERNASRLTGGEATTATRRIGGVGGAYSSNLGNPTSVNNGQNGGSLGESGNGSLGGNAGYAINKNGFNVTIIAGDNAEQIKGEKIE